MYALATFPRGKAAAYVSLQQMAKPSQR